MSARILCRSGVALLLALIVLVPGGQARGVSSPVPVNVRVALVQQAGAVDFLVNGSYQLVDLSTSKSVSYPLNNQESYLLQAQTGFIQVLKAGKPVASFKGPLAVREIKFRASVLSGGGLVTEKNSPDGLLVLGAGGTTRPLSGVSEPVAMGAQGTAVLSGGCGLNLVSVAGKRYRGELEVRLDDTGLTVINELSLEEYLRGVVPCEMPAAWPAEALRAQAVAARSYVLWQIKNTGNQPFHVTADQSSQVYGGYDAEDTATDKAVAETGRIVALYKGEPIPAFFHSSSGGYTENSEDVWKTPLPYLKGKADPFDRNDKHYNWQVTYTADQLKEQLAAAGYRFEKVIDLAEKERTATGARVKRLLVSGTGPVGEAVYQEIYNADNVRKALGLKSALFSLEKVYDQDKHLAAVVITGNGWGHGLGMSQWGALGMARKGYNYRDILAYYYTGIELAPYGR
ncbi:MAG: SpoIID/LytB domain-containing protein [Peptococcaceae bacterium]|nr:MAG: SpoIID/LytB domain-containing protein [Peptococcaceae bacterium]